MANLLPDIENIDFLPLEAQKFNTNLSTRGLTIMQDITEEIFPKIRNNE
jgi:hypothetical protein